MRHRMNHFLTFKFDFMFLFSLGRYYKITKRLRNGAWPSSVFLVLCSRVVVRFLSNKTLFRVLCDMVLLRVFSDWFLFRDLTDMRAISKKVILMVLRESYLAPLLIGFSLDRVLLTVLGDRFLFKVLSNRILLRVLFRVLSPQVLYRVLSPLYPVYLAF